MGKMLRVMALSTDQWLCSAVTGHYDCYIKAELPESKQQQQPKRFGNVWTIFSSINALLSNAVSNSFLLHLHKWFSLDSIEHFWISRNPSLSFSVLLFFSTLAAPSDAVIQAEENL